jgi:hypothetical protein
METIGGYRLVRSLGSGPRAEVWLGHADRGLVAVKLFRPHVPEESIGAEIESLGRASSRHLLRLDDLATAPDGRPCLSLERLSVRSLGGLLDRGEVEAGEAVTILAPIALAIAELHRVGVAHGAIRAASVLFDDAGAPVLTGFGAARPIAAFPDPPEASALTAAGLASESLVLQDVNQLAALGRLVLSRVPGAEEEAERIVVPSDGVGVGEWPALFAESLFRLAPAGPLRADRLTEGGPIDPAAGAAVVSAARADAGGGPGAGGAASATPEEPSSATGAGWMERLARRMPWSQVVLGRVRDFLRPVRRSVWILAAVVGACLVAGLVLIPPAEDPVPSSTPARGTIPEAASPGASDDPDDPRVLGGDPVAAAEALLARRSDCFRIRSVLCLDAVDQLGSAAMDADRYAIRLVQQGGVPPEEPNYGAATVSVVERLGDAVLMEVAPGPAASGEPAGPAGSILLVREDVGWRIRDLVPPGVEDGGSVDPEG